MPMTRAMTRAMKQANAENVTTMPTTTPRVMTRAMKQANAENATDTTTAPPVRRTFVRLPRLRHRHCRCQETEGNCPC